MLSAFLHSDDMFAFDRRILNTEFFIRTEAPTFHPFGDEWEEQMFNQPESLLKRARNGLRSILKGKASA